MATKESKLKSKKVTAEPQIKGSSKEPATMAELLAKYAKTVRGFATGDKVKGKVISLADNLVVVDIGGKSEGVVTEKAFAESRDYIKTLKAGDEVTVTVISPETREGTLLLSFRQASHDASWDRLIKAKESGEEVVVLGKGSNNSGVSVEIDGINGFVPASHLGKEASDKPQELVGKHFAVMVLEIDRRNQKAMFSEKGVSEKAEIAAGKETLKEVEEGKIYTGVVTTLTNFGCFVKISVSRGKEVEGLVHISELAWSKTAKSSDVVKVGDKLDVKVIGIKDGRLALSLKQAKVDPWTSAANKYAKDDKVEGRVTKLSDFGVFVEVEPGIEGLIHITKIPPTQKYKVGDKVKCYVEEIDTKAKKLSLGLVLTAIPIGYK